MALVYKVNKGYEDQVIPRLFNIAELRGCTKVGDAAGTIRARELIKKGKPRSKILEFKKATYIKSERELRNPNIVLVSAVGD